MWWGWVVLQDDQRHGRITSFNTGGLYGGVCLQNSDILVAEL